MELIKLLLDNGADVNAHSSVGFTPLHMAARLGHLEIVKALLQRGANVYAKNYGCIYDGNGYTPLHEAVQNGHAEVVQLLLQYDADINAKTDMGYTALHLAVSNDYINVIQTLLKDEKINVNIRNSYGDTPLDRTAQKEISNLLRSHGARSSSDCFIL